MTFTYPAMVAWDPNGKQTVKNVSFQVYATTDTAYTTPLPITDPFGVPLPGNILNSGTQGVFPQFNQATNATVVVSDSAHTYAWTIIAIQPPTQDAAVAGFINSPTSATAANLRALVPVAWQANTAYTLGQPAVSPSGDVVTAKAAFTSGVNYSAADWNLSPSYAPASGSANYTPQGTTIPKWVAATAYTPGQQVISPSGCVVAAYNAHTSSAAFNPSNWYADLGWLISCFTANGTNGEKLSFFYSPDGKTVFGGGGNPAYTDPNTGASLRDPSFTKLPSGVLVEAHTVNNGINKNFAVLTGPTLSSLTQVALIDCSALPDISRIWAPEVVIDPAQPTRPYIFFSKMNAAGTNGSMYWVQATNDALTAWTAPVHMSWTAEPAHYIDGSFIQVGGTWYMFYSIGSDIYRATSSTLTGTYTTDKGTANWAGWGSGIEGPEIVQYAPSKYRIYMDRYQSGLGYGYSESTDLNTWTAVTGLAIASGSLAPGGLIRHGSFYKIPDQATLDTVLAQLELPMPDPRTVYGPTAYTQGATATVSPVAVTTINDTTASNNDLMVSSDGGGKFTFKEAGDYQIYGTFNVTVGTGVTRSFAELANSAGTTTYARTPGAGEDVFQLIVPSYRAGAGEQILIRTFLAFSGGGSATINGTVRFIRRSR